MKFGVLNSSDGQTYQTVVSGPLCTLRSPCSISPTKIAVISGNPSRHFAHSLCTACANCIIHPALLVPCMTGDKNHRFFLNSPKSSRCSPGSQRRSAAQNVIAFQYSLLYAILIPCLLYHKRKKKATVGFTKQIQILPALPLYAQSIFPTFSGTASVSRVSHSISSPSGTELRP